MSNQWLRSWKLRTVMAWPLASLVWSTTRWLIYWNKRVGLGVHIVAIEDDFGILENVLEAPAKGA